jgi:hypothetical protein
MKLCLKTLKMVLRLWIGRRVINTSPRKRVEGRTLDSSGQVGDQWHALVNMVKGRI